MPYRPFKNCHFIILWDKHIFEIFRSENIKMINQIVFWNIYILVLDCWKKFFKEYYLNSLFLHSVIFWNCSETKQTIEQAIVLWRAAPSHSRRFLGNSIWNMISAVALPIISHNHRLGFQQESFSKNRHLQDLSVKRKEVSFVFLNIFITMRLILNKIQQSC